MDATYDYQANSNAKRSSSLNQAPNIWPQPQQSYAMTGNRDRDRDRDKEKLLNPVLGPPGQPATPRMLRSISGTLKSQTNSTKSIENVVDESPHYVATDHHSRSSSLQPSSHQNNPSNGPQQQQQQQQHNSFSNVPQMQVPVVQPLQPAPVINVPPHKRTASRNNPELLPPVSIESEMGHHKPSSNHHHKNNDNNNHSNNNNHHHNNRNSNNNNNTNNNKYVGPSTPSDKQKNQQQFHRKSIGDWDFVKTIGAGSMGKVKLAQHNLTKEICAVKIIPRAAKLYQRAHASDPPPVNPQEAMQRQKEFEKEVARDKRTIREAALGQLLFHPFICRLYEMVPMTNHYYMLFEYVDGGQMLDYIVAHGSLKEKHARKFARGIGSALEYCHKNNVVHRDLKIENIMINEKGDIKIIDFGLSNLYSPKTLLKTYCGSLYFAAPELLSAKPYIGPEVDVWSFGVVLYVLVCGKVPFDDQSVSVLHEKIKRGNVEYPNFLSRECVSLLSRMLVVDPLKRATLYEVLNHPWMNKGFDYRVMNYVPKRTPLTLPLDPEIIKTIASFDLGSVESITNDLTNVLTSLEYQMSRENWIKITEQGRDYSSASNAHVLPDPTGGFHPLVSIYYLVDEMKKRKRAKEEAIKSQILQKQQQQQQQQQQTSQLAHQEASQQLKVSQPVASSKPKTMPQAGSEPVKKYTTEQKVDNVLSKPPADRELEQRVSQEQKQKQNLQSPVKPPISTPTIKQSDLGSSDKSQQVHTPIQQISKPTNLAPIPFPERVHASTIPSVFEKTSQSTQLQNVPKLITTLPEQIHDNGKENSPEMQTLDPGSTKGGINAIFRKLSTKKPKYPQLQQPQIPQSLSPSQALSQSPSPAESGIPRISFGDNEDDLDLSLIPIKNDPLVRRGVSMKVTAKERLHAPEENQEQKKIVSKKTHNRSSSTSNDKNKFHGYVPVEYLPPLPNITQNTNHSSGAKPVNTAGRRLHPTARAKSVGGHSRKQSNDYRNADRPPLPNIMLSQNSDELIGNPNNFFDDVALDDVEYQEVPKLTEEQIINQFNNAKPNTMPSIEHCKTLFLKGFFSVQTTSTKPLPVIRYNIIHVLSKLGVKFQEVKGGFVCAHAPSLKEQNEILNNDIIDDYDYNDDDNDDDDDDDDDEKYDDITSEERKLYGDAFKSTSSSIEQDQNSGTRSVSDTREHKTPSRQPSVGAESTQLASPISASKSSHRSTGSNTSSHRLKFSIGNSILNHKKKNGSGTLLPPNTPAGAKIRKDLFDEYDYDEDTIKHLQQQMEDDSVDSLNGLNIGGGSDMLISSRIEQRARHQRTSSSSSYKPKSSPLKFEIHIVKVPLVGLYGVQFKKLLGNTWNYKSLASRILNELNL